jgi:outer membrane murein-binding lipoprotein Lpp
MPLHFDTEHQMNSMLDGRPEEARMIANLEEQVSNLTREVGVIPSAPPASVKRSPTTPAATKTNWHYVASVGCLLAACIGVAAWWWSSFVGTAKMPPSDPVRLTRAAPATVAPDAVAPTAAALHSLLPQQLQPMAQDLAALSQTVEQLKARQEQLIHDNENLASQLKASREETARSNSIIDQIKADQIQMARESLTFTERLDASQEQLARVIANASAPKAIPEAEPKAMPEPPPTASTEEPKLSPEEPKVMPDIPLPRPRQSANVAQMHRPAPTPQRSQARKPQPSLAWPWSVR